FAMTITRLVIASPLTPRNWGKHRKRTFFEIKSPAIHECLKSLYLNLLVNDSRNPSFFKGGRGRIFKPLNPSPPPFKKGGVSLHIVAGVLCEPHALYAARQTIVVISD